MIPQEPYTSWNVKEENFPRKGDIQEQLRFLIHYAVLAPSSHNTQPWRFQVSGNTIVIFPDYRRALSYSDRTNRQLYISLGCALGNLVIVAHHFGFKTDIKYFPENDLSDAAACISFLNNARTKNNTDKLFTFITKRRTNRLPSIEKPVDKEILNEIISLCREKDVFIHCITQPALQKKISEIAQEASIFAFNDSIFKQELSEWIRSIYTKRHDGIALFDFNIPGILTIFAPTMIRFMPAKIQSKLDKELIEKAPVLLVVSGRNDDRYTWIKTGLVAEHILLACAKNNISVAPFAGVIEHEPSNKKLQKTIKIKEKPLFFARIGYTNKIPHHSPRRGIEEVLK